MNRIFQCIGDDVRFKRQLSPLKRGENVVIAEFLLLNYCGKIYPNSIPMQDWMWKYYEL